MTMTHAGLFEGYGGTTMAAALALGPLDTLWYSDIKPASVALLAHRFPGVANLGDMTTIDYAGAPRVDVLTASWPCQPHSSAGKRLGEADPRALWPHVASAIAQVRPKVFLGENVARVAGNGELRRVIRSLAELGYVGAWRCVRASDVGAPHRRDRCFVVAVDPAAADALGVVVRDESGWRGGADGSCAGVARHDGAQRDPSRGGELTLLPTPTANHGDPRRGSPSPEVGARRIAAGRRMLEDVVAAHLVPLLPTLMPSVAVRASAERWGIYAAAIARWEPIIGRPAPDPTVISARTGGPQLAAPFVEWMMGLPAGWVTDVAVTPKASSLRNAHLSLLGDGVVPQQGAHALRWMLADLGTRLAVAA